MRSFIPSDFGASLDPLDKGRGTSTGMFSAGVPTGSGLRGAGALPGASGTGRGKINVPGTLTVPPVAPKPKLVPKVLPKTSVIPGGAQGAAPKVVVPKFKPSRATLPGGRGSGSGGSGGSGSGGDAGSDAGSDAGIDAGTGSGSSAPAWASVTYVNDILAVSGWTGPSNYYPGVTYTVGTTTLDGLTAPTISTSTSGGASVQSLPTSADWTNVASLVLAAKQAADAGVAPPTTGGGTITVTNIPTGGGGYDIFGGGSSLPATDESTPTELVTDFDDEMTVSEDVEAPAEEGFLAKYKWWLAGGVGAAGVYAYMHRMDPSKYPLPEAISKLVRG